MSLDVSVWLIPKKEQEVKLQKVINDLAKKYNAYPFIPHLTIYYFGSVSILNNIFNFIDNTIKEMQKFSLDFDTFDYSGMFTATLFAKYKTSDALLSLYNMFHDEFKNVVDYKHSPHISLMYKNKMNAEDKLKEIGQISVPQILTFDRLYVITKEGEIIKENKDVLKWKLTHQLTFK